MLEIYRYEIECFENDEIFKTKGFIAAKSYAKAVKELINYCTSPTGECCLTGINIYEVDSCHGMITDSDIKETFKYENKRSDD